MIKTPHERTGGRAQRGSVEEVHHDEGDRHAGGVAGQGGGDRGGGDVQGGVQQPRRHEHRGMASVFFFSEKTYGVFDFY